MKKVTDNKKKKSLPKGIRHLASGKFIADVCINGKRKTKTVDTLEEAIIARQKMLNNDATVSVTEQCDDTSGWTLKQAYDRTKSLYWEDSAWSYKVASNFKSISTYFGETMPIGKITLDDIDAYVNTLLTKGNSNGTINRKLAILSRIFRTAIERGKLEVMPKIPLRKEAHHRVRFLTQQEENTFVKAFIQNGYNTHAEVFLILLYTGFRLGECWRIECRDINLELGTITAWKTKNGHPRTIPIVDKIRPILERKIFEVGGSGKIFPTADNRWFEITWNRIKRMLGLEEDAQLVPHALRHTCASRLAQRGVSMMVIKEWMGHSNIKTTMRYTHLAPKDLQEAAKILSL